MDDGRCEFSGAAQRLHNTYTNTKVNVRPCPLIRLHRPLTMCSRNTPFPRGPSALINSTIRLRSKALCQHIYRCTKDDYDFSSLRQATSTLSFQALHTGERYQQPKTIRTRRQYQFMYSLRINCHAHLWSNVLCSKSLRFLRLSKITPPRQ